MDKVTDGLKHDGGKLRLSLIKKDWCEALRNLKNIYADADSKSYTALCAAEAALNREEACAPIEENGFRKCGMCGAVIGGHFDRNWKTHDDVYCAHCGQRLR